MNLTLHGLAEGSKRLCLLMVGLSMAMTAAQAQQDTSLADAARQARAQKQGTAAQSSNQAQQLADQLSEDQNHSAKPQAPAAASGAPAAAVAATPPASAANAATPVSPPSATAAPASVTTPAGASEVQPPTQAQDAKASTATPNTTASSSTPAGPKPQPFTYCKSRTQCWDASVIVPTGAQLISSDCKQYIFQVKVQGTPFLLLAGPANGEGCANSNAGGAEQVRWSELAAPDNARAPGTFSMIGSQQTTLEGKPAIITQIGLRKNGESWMGKRAEIESNSIPLVVGCLGHRDQFAAADAICSDWIGSLRLP